MQRLAKLPGPEGRAGSVHVLSASYKCDVSLKRALDRVPPNRRLSR